MDNNSSTNNNSALDFSYPGANTASDTSFAPARQPVSDSSAQTATSAQTTVAAPALDIGAAQSQATPVANPAVQLDLTQPAIQVSQPFQVDDKPASVPAAQTEESGIEKANESTSPFKSIANKLSSISSNFVSVDSNSDSSSVESSPSQEETVSSSESPVDPMIALQTLNTEITENGSEEKSVEGTMSEPLPPASVPITNNMPVNKDPVSDPVAMSEPSAVTSNPLSAATPLSSDTNSTPVAPVEPISEGNFNIVFDPTSLTGSSDVVENAAPALVETSTVPIGSSSYSTDTTESITDQKPSMPTTPEIQQVGNTTEAASTFDPLDPSASKSKPSKKYMYGINQLLDMVIERKASDLHITADYPAMLRIDGEMVPVGNEPVTPEQAVELILEVLPEQKKELLEVNREVDLAHSHKDLARFRINAYYQKQSLAAAMRLIPNKIRSIDDLNLPQIYHQFAKISQGLVLVTGPTGHGKSSTLAAILHEINMSRACHIITIEDPIEYILPKGKAMVDQREMHDDTHSWEIALKSALRQDPDVVLVGEMRDYETIASAITLAETGHLVFATLHTNSAAQSIDRIIDVFPEHQQAQIRAQLSNIVEVVVAQRLIPINGGGRRAVSEIMLANPAVRNLIREAKTHQLDNVIRTSADLGMISLEHSLVKLVRDGLITMEKAQEYAVHPEEVVRLLKG